MISQNHERLRCRFRSNSRHILVDEDFFCLKADRRIIIKNAYSWFFEKSFHHYFDERSTII